MTFETAMKHAYAEALAPYGFQKVKGKYPYYIRMIGDEIAQIISFEKAWAPSPYTRFIVGWEIASVYRGSIRLDESPRDRNWSNYVDDKEHSAFFEFWDEKKYNPDKAMTIGGHDVTMEEEIQRSVNATISYAIPKMNQLTTLKDCIETTLGSAYLYLDKINFGRAWKESEGLLNFKVYTVKEFTKKWEAIVNESKNTEYWEETVKQMEAQVAAFTKYNENETLRREIEEELEFRKQFNQAMLRECGIKF